MFTLEESKQEEEEERELQIIAVVASAAVTRPPSRYAIDRKKRLTQINAQTTITDKTIDWI